MYMYMFKPSTLCLCCLFVVQEIAGQPVKMMGNVLTMVERVDDEFTKLLQHTDAHSTDYVTKYAVQNVYCIKSTVCIYSTCTCIRNYTVMLIQVNSLNLI